MHLDACRQLLETSYRDLMTQWDATREGWTDQRAMEFEKTYLSPLKPEIMLAMESIRELDQLISKARKDCE